MKKQKTNREEVVIMRDGDVFLLDWRISDPAFVCLLLDDSGKRWCMREVETLRNTVERMWFQTESRIT